MKLQLKIASLITTFLIFSETEGYAAVSRKMFTSHPTLIKFFGSMCGVFLSALVIWGSLKLYQKLAAKSSSKLDNVDYSKTLESPKDFKEAITLFLNKTDR